VRRLADETIAYDLDRHRGHCLNEAAAAVWQECDGRRDLAQIARRVSARLGHPVDEDFVALALRGLQRARLLDSAPAPRAVSRREVARRLGLGGALAVLLPTVITLVAPTVLQAATNQCTPLQCILGGATRRGCCCTSNNRRCIQFGGGGFNFCGGAAC
jgi:hypothetical protein